VNKKEINMKRLLLTSVLLLCCSSFAFADCEVRTSLQKSMNDIASVKTLQATKIHSKLEPIIGQMVSDDRITNRAYDRFGFEAAVSPSEDEIFGALKKATAQVLVDELKSISFSSGLKIPIADASELEAFLAMVEDVDLPSEFSRNFPQMWMRQLKEKIRTDIDNVRFLRSCEISTVITTYEQIIEQGTLFGTPMIAVEMKPIKSVSSKFVNPVIGADRYYLVVTFEDDSQTEFQIGTPDYRQYIFNRIL